MKKEEVLWAQYGSSWRGWVLVLAFLVLSSVGRVTGQEKPPDEKAPLVLEPIVVTATAIPTPLSQTSASVEVITREQIVAQQTVSLTDLLRHTVGLHVDQPGARGSVSSVYIRGGDPNFTMVLIDGVKVNDLTNNRGGSFDFATLSTDNIERIEIVRGPLSALYGSDAMSGVINIITRQGTAKATRNVEVSGGRFGYIRPFVQARGLLGEFDYAVSGSFLDNGEPVNGSTFYSGNVQGNVGYLFSETMELRGVWRYTKSHATAFPDASGGVELAVLRDLEERDIDEVTFGTTWVHKPLHWWEYRLRFGLYNRQEDVTSPGIAPGAGNPFGVPPGVSDTDFQRYEVVLQHLFAIAQGIRFTVGAQAQFEDGRNRGSFAFIGPTDFDLSRDTYAPFLEVQLSFIPGLQVQGGVRVDFPEGFDAEVSPRLGASYTTAATQTTLRVNWGEGFKVPSFFSLGDPIVGNPDLVPETSRSVGAGVTQHLWQERVTLSVSYFYNTFKDLIDFDPGAFQLLNRSEVTTEGVELSLQLQPWPMLQFTSFMTYVTTDIVDSNARLRNRPKWRGGFAIQWRPLEALVVDVNALFVGDSLDFSVPTGERQLDGYGRIDLAATWTINPTWQLFLAIDNVLDADYAEAIGFSAPGIRPRSGVRATF